MVKRKIDYSDVVLDEPTERYLSTKKKSTADTYRGNLKRLQKFYGKPLTEFLKEEETQRKLNLERSLTEKVKYAEGTVREFIAWMQDLGYANNPIRGSLTAIQDMMRYYELPISFRDIDVPPPISRKKNGKYAWVIDELRQFVNAAPTHRDKAIILTMLQSGMAVNEICDLNYSDVKRELERGDLPLLLKLVRKKNSVQFKTLLGADAVKYLKLYLETRTDLDDESPLFTKWRSEERINKEAIETRLREMADGLDFIKVKPQEMNPARPHSLRSAFRSLLTGKTDGDLIKFWMGDEIGPKAGAYLNLHDDEHRERYMSIEKYISLWETSEQVIAGEKGGAVIERAYLDRLNRLEADNRSLNNLVGAMEQKIGEQESLLDTVINRLVWLEGADESPPGKWVREDGKWKFKLTDELTSR